MPTAAAAPCAGIRQLAVSRPLPRRPAAAFVEKRHSPASCKLLSAFRVRRSSRPRRLCSDIAREGILLAGGGTLLLGLAELVEAQTGMPTYLTESPRTCVAVGSGHALEHYDKLTGSATGRRGRAAASTTR